jgi:sugar/nucleoside kinase (ribokinase family)
VAASDAVVLSMAERAKVAAAAGRAVARAEMPDGLAALVGFDGFIDAIIDVVGTRHGMAHDAYDRVGTISALAERVAAAAGKSTNLELVVHEERFGGNGPLLAGGLAQFGLPVTYIGAVGQESDASVVHPVFAPFAERCSGAGGRVIPVAPPARTDALEFDDGKVMLGKPQNLQGITWASLKARFGLDGPGGLREMIGGVRLVGSVNWVMAGGVGGIWEGLSTEVLPTLPAGKRPRMFIDLCDPAKRTDADVKQACGQISQLARLTAVSLGLNFAEAQRLDAVMGVHALAGVTPLEGEKIARAAAALRSAMGLDCVVIHPRGGAGGADAGGGGGSGTCRWIDGPLVARPKLSTGAGDHFNAGFCFGQLLGLPLEQCLAVGVGTSGAYVRDAASPSRSRLGAFLAELPGAEG